jgi:hypothetical protein
MPIRRGFWRRRGLSFSALTMDFVVVNVVQVVVFGVVEVGEGLRVGVVNSVDDKSSGNGKGKLQIPSE